MCFFYPSLQPSASGNRTVRLQDTQNAVTYWLAVSKTVIRRACSFRLTSDNLDLGNAVGVTEDDTDLRGGSTLTGELANLVDDLLGGGLQPGGSGARVREGGGRHALALAVKSTHVVGVVVLMTAERLVWS